MTLPRLPRIIPADGFAAISGVCFHTDTQAQAQRKTGMCVQIH